MALFKKTAMLYEDGSSIAIVSNDYELFWFKTLLNQHEQGYYWNMTDEEFKSELTGFDYIILSNAHNTLTTKSGSGSEAFKSWLDEGYTTTYENAAGKIVKQTD